MEIKKIECAEKAQLENLIAEIESNLPDTAWWLPLNDTAKNHFFDDTWTYFLGLFDGETLVAASALFLNEHEFGETANETNIPLVNTAEIGRCMVSPTYRGHGYMFTLNTRLIEIAKEKGIRRLIATIHPDNVASNKTFIKNGFQLHSKVTKYNLFPRNVYVKEI